MEVIYALDFSPKALKDVQFYKKLGDKGIIRKIDKLLAELEQHPRTRPQGQRGVLTQCSPENPQEHHLPTSVAAILLYEPSLLHTVFLF